MNYASIFASCTMALSFSACGDDGGSSKTKAPATPVAAEPTPATTAAVTDPAAAGTDPAAAEPPKEAVPTTPSTDSAAKCETVLANSWKSLKPALAMLPEESAYPEAEYTKNDYFLKKCSGLKAEHLECLAKSENPLVGIEECKINEGAKSSDKLRLPSFRKRKDKPEELPEADQSKLLASVVGTWKNDWKSYGQVTTWKIAKSGDVKQTTVRNGKSVEKDLKISFERKGQINVQNSPTSSQSYSYLPVNKKTAYFCNNLAYGAHPIADDADFVLATSGEHVILKGETCKVLTDSGHFVDATCTWEKKRKKKTGFKVSYQEPGRSRASELSYQMIAGHLVDQRQVDTSKFVKK